MEAFAAARKLELLIAEKGTGVEITGTPGSDGHPISNLFISGDNGWSGAFATNTCTVNPHVTLSFCRRVRVDWV
jgi:hypothetical protein